MLKGLPKWKILNSKEVRNILGIVKQQWGCDFSFDGGFLEGKDGDIFLISRDIEKLDLERLHIDSLGLYFGQLRNPNRAKHDWAQSQQGDLGNELRLSIEGSQLVGKTAAKNVVELNDGEFKLWLRGEDVEKALIDCSGYVLVKHNSDFIGCGKCKEGKILNFVPKARRVANA
mgnify:CR=1 FL=1